MAEDEREGNVEDTSFADGNGCFWSQTSYEGSRYTVGAGGNNSNLLAAIDSFKIGAQGANC